MSGPRPATPTPATPFAREVAINFTHSDPAGIIYYPHYFDMFADLIEDWLRTAIGLDYGRTVLADGLGLPVERARCQFRAPVRMGDRLNLTLRVAAVDEMRVELEIHGSAHGRACLDAALTCAMTRLATRETLPIPPGLRTKLEACRAPGKISR